jgi:hypothetical protein
VRIPFAPSEDGQFPAAAEPTSDGQDAFHPTAGFLGATACAECHREQHDGFIQTAHHLTSRVGSPDAFIGPLDAPDNRMRSEETKISFTMKRTDDGAAQTVVLGDWSFQVPMDVIAGSGKIAQTFLYWHGDALYQAHASYFRQPDRWLNSPGFNDRDAKYSRVIRPACLECHVTYIKQKRPPNHYHKDSAIWGISCERCHGPGKDHVDYHRVHPSEGTGKYIVNPREMSRSQSLDICGQCHGGSFDLLQEPFAFRPGDRLEAFHKSLETAIDADKGSVHTSNQLIRLKLSSCFHQSEMTCATCHNPHLYQRGNVAMFSAECMDCHQPAACGMHRVLGPKIAENCIDCHMPRTQHTDVEMMVKRGVTIESADHFIRIDQASTDEYLAR